MSGSKITMKVELDTKAFKNSIKQIENALDRLNKKSNKLNSNNSALKAELQAQKLAAQAARERMKEEGKRIRQMAQLRAQAERQQASLAERAARQRTSIADRSAREQVRIAQQAAREQARAAERASASQSSSMSSFSVKASNAFNSVKTVALAAFAAIGAAAIGAGALMLGENGAISYAMKTESALENLKMVFGENSNEMTKWLQSNAASLGLAEAQMLQYGASYGRIIKSTTSDMNEASELTKELVAQTAIISSGSGFSKDVVYEKIMSGLRGETEAIEDLGINIMVANLQRSKAFEQIGKGMRWEEMDYQMQQQIILLSILEQSYARYGNTMVSTVGTKHGEFISSLKDIKNALGQAFLPVYASILPSLMKFAEVLKKIIVTIGQFTYALFGNSKGMKEIKKAQKNNNAIFDDSYGKQIAASKSVAKVDESNNKAAKSVKKLSTGVKSSSKEAKKATEEFKKLNKGLQSFDTLNILQSDSSDRKLNVPEVPEVPETPEVPEIPEAPEVKVPDMSSFKDSGFDFSGNYEDLNGDFESMLEQMQNPSKKVQEWADRVQGWFKKIKDTWTRFKKSVSKLFKKDDSGKTGIEKAIEALLPNAGGIIATIASYFAITKFADIASKIKKGLSLLRLAFTSVSWPVLGITVVIGLIVKAVMELWQKSEKFRDNVSSIWTSMKESFSEFWEGLKPILQQFGDSMKLLWDETIKPLWEKFKSFIESIAEFIAIALEKLKPFTDFFIDVLMPIIEVAFVAIYETVALVINNIVDVIGVVIDVLKGLTDFLINVFKGDWSAAWDSIKGIFATVGKFMGNMAINIGNFFIGTFNGILEGVTDLVNTIVNLLRKVKFDIPDWIPGIGGMTVDFGFIPEGNFKAPKIPKIPKLAQGGLVKPRKPRTVIVGDNMYEDEIISPESKMVDSFKKANEDMFGKGGISNYESNKLLERIIELLESEQRLTLDEMGMARMVRKAMNKMESRNGRLV